MAPKNALTVGTAKARKGRWTTGELVVGHYPDTPITTPVNILCGRKPGPTLWVQAAIHGAEVGGAMGLLQLFKKIDPAKMSGAIVGIGGMAATKGAPGRAHTMATKAGLGGLARGMALDLAKHGITSNIAVVGSFDTIREGSSSVEPVFNKGLKIPMGRKGVPQDMANLIRFLVGPAARYITGQTIHVNGGAYLTN